MTRRSFGLCGAFVAVSLASALSVSPASAFRQTLLTPWRAALAAAVEGHFRAVDRRTGLIYYARRRTIPRPMLASIRAGETYRVIFVDRDSQLGDRRRSTYRLSIAGRRVRLNPASVRGNVQAFHAAALRVGRHLVRLAVVDLASRRSRVAYAGQILVTGGGPVYLTISDCRPRHRCRVAVRQNGRTLFERP